jgi:hypothetical protein
MVAMTVMASELLGRCALVTPCRGGGRGPLPSSAKATIQYAVTFPLDLSCRGILDAPPAGSMTALEMRELQLLRQPRLLKVD